MPSHRRRGSEGGGKVSKRGRRSAGAMGKAQEVWYGWDILDSEVEIEARQLTL